RMACAGTPEGSLAFQRRGTLAVWPTCEPYERLCIQPLPGHGWHLCRTVRAGNRTCPPASQGFAQEPLFKVSLPGYLRRVEGSRDVCETIRAPRFQIPQKPKLSDRRG